MEICIKKNFTSLAYENLRKLNSICSCLQKLCVRKISISLAYVNLLKCFCARKKCISLAYVETGERTLWAKGILYAKDKMQKKYVIHSLIGHIL